DSHRSQRRNGVFAPGCLYRDAMGGRAYSQIRAHSRARRGGRPADTSLPGGDGSHSAPRAAAVGISRRCGAAAVRIGLAALLRVRESENAALRQQKRVQVIVDMPNGTTLEETAKAANALGRAALDQPEVVNVQTYTGTASPFNFNGLVRHYYLRRGSNAADIQVNLQRKGDRKLQ